MDVELNIELYQHKSFAHHWSYIIQVILANGEVIINLGRTLSLQPNQMFCSIMLLTLNPDFSSEKFDIIDS